MILIRRGKEPDSLLKYRKSDPQTCYEEIDGGVANDIRRQMWKEQGGLCAYCMRQIKHPKDVRIEHYRVWHPDGGGYRTQYLRHWEWSKNRKEHKEAAVVYRSATSKL